MVRGSTTFICTNCKHKFLGMDIELGATALSQPISCHKCKSIRTRPTALFPFYQNKLYEGIWKRMERKI